MNEWGAMFADGEQDAISVRGSQVVNISSSASFSAVVDVSQFEMEGELGGRQVMAVLAADFNKSVVGALSVGSLIGYQGDNYVIVSMIAQADGPLVSIRAERRVGTKKATYVHSRT